MEKIGHVPSVRNPYFMHTHRMHFVILQNADAWRSTLDNEWAGNLSGRRPWWFFTPSGLWMRACAVPRARANILHCLSHLISRGTRIKKNITTHWDRERWNTWITFNNRNEGNFPIQVHDQCWCFVTRIVDQRHMCRHRHLSSGRVRLCVLISFRSFLISYLVLAYSAWYFPGCIVCLSSNWVWC